MSRENVEVVRQGIAAFNAHDIDGWLSFLHPEFEFVDRMAALGEEAGSGIETIRRQAEGWLEAFPDFCAETEEFIDAGDRVVTVTHWHGTGSASGLDYSVRAAEVNTLRDGKIFHLEMGFQDKAEALEAVGLGE